MKKFLAVTLAAALASASSSYGGAFNGGQMMAIETGLDKVPAGWKGWIRVPVPPGADVSKILVATAPMDRIILLLDVPSREGFQAQDWLTWSSKAASDAFNAGIRIFQIGRGGEGDEKGWGQAPSEYFQNLFVPTAQKIKALTGKLLFCGAPWQGSGAIPSRWMFDNTMGELVDILGSSNDDQEELAYLKNRFLDKGLCESLWIDCAGTPFKAPSDWAVAMHKFLSWCLNNQLEADSPVAFVLPRSTLSQEQDRTLLALAAHLMDGPLSTCASAIIVYPRGKACGLLVGNQYVAAIIPQDAYPMSITLANCADILLDSAIAFSMLDGTPLDLRIRSGPKTVSATLLRPPVQGCYVQLQDSDVGPKAP